MTATRPIRLGMVGGGEGAFIGAVHRMAARLDGHFELVAGCFSSNADRSKVAGTQLGLPNDRVYGDFASMAKREARLKEGVEAVAIVTPNHMHFAPARAFLKRGIHVICDKPLTSTLADAKQLVKVAAQSDALFVLTHNYSGYPMIREARQKVARGDLGALRLVQVEYAQDWLTVDQESQQARWRTDPEKAGPGGSIGDIGTHAFHLACFVSGLEPQALAADLTSFVSGRELDDNAHILMRWKGGARGMLWCSQVAPGNRNGLRLRLYGETGGLEWSQEEPNALWHAPFGEPKRLLTRNGPGTGSASRRVARIPAGHPEGYLEGFATIYSEAAAAIRSRQEGRAPPEEVTYPTLQDGLLGMQFIDACIRSSKSNAAWVSLKS